MRTAVLVDLMVADDIGRDGRTLWELHLLHREHAPVDQAVAALIADGLVEDVDGLIGLTPAGVRDVERFLDPDALYVEPSAD